MPPKKRSKKAEPASPKKAGESSKVTANVKASTSKATTNAKASTESKAPGTSSKEDPSNAQKGLTGLPVELISNILANYKSIGNFTSLPDGDEKFEARRKDVGPDEVDLLAGEPVLPRVYMERPDVLRALSQTCVAYRRAFLPLLYERLEVCVTTRAGNPMKAFYKHVGEGLERKCSGLAARPDLWQFVGKVHVSLTRYKTDTILPAFLKCMQNLPNLHTIKVLHAHTQMTTAIKTTFESASLATVRTVIVPAFCHEILRACPEVRSVWCTEGDGSKLVGALGKGKCGRVEEVRGCYLSDMMMKRLVKIAPNLRIIELENTDETQTALLKSFKHLHTIDLLQTRYRRSVNPILDPSAPGLQKTIKACRAVLKDSPSEERKYLRLCWRSEKGVDDGERAFVQCGLE